MSAIITIAIALPPALRPSDEAVAAEGEAAVPRYRLAVGQELQYHGELRSVDQVRAGRELSRAAKQFLKAPPEVSGNTIDWRVVVVRQNRDGSWLVVFEETLGRGLPKPVFEAANSHVSFCNIYPDGRTSDSHPNIADVAPERLFGRLPPDAAAAKLSWNWDRLGGLDQFVCTPLSDRSSNGVFALVERQQGLLNTERGRVSSSTFLFDRRAGINKHIEWQSTSPGPFNADVDLASKQTIDLVASKTHDKAWISQFMAEMSKYFKGVQDYRALIHSAMRDPEQGTAVSAEAQAALRKARDNAKEPMAIESLDTLLRDHERFASWRLGPTKQIAEQKGRPAPDWSPEDFDAKTLIDYRGKVVLLGFFQLSNGVSDVEAALAVQKLAEKFRDRPVVVLGMSDDKNEQFVHQAAQTLKLSYHIIGAAQRQQVSLPMVFAGSPKIGKYSWDPQSPELFVIDQQGKIYDIFAFYESSFPSPAVDWQTEVSKAVEQLLGK